MGPQKIIRKVDFELGSVPDSEGLVLEFLDENEDAFMQIRVNEDNSHQIIFYRSDEHICFPMSELLKGIEIAKQRVFNVPIDM